MGISVAKTTDAEAIAGLDDSKFLSPAKLRKALNANGGSPIFACRAWVNFNGSGVVAIRDGGNVSSVTDNGVGVYAVNFINQMNNQNYSCLVSCTAGYIESRIGSGVIFNTNSVGIETGFSAFTNVDCEQVCVAIFG